MLKRLLLVLIVIAIAGCLYLDWDGADPEIRWLRAPESVGDSSAISFEALDAGKGLRSIQAILTQGESSQVVFEELQARSWAPWEDGVGQRSLSINPIEALTGFQLAEGDFDLTLRVADHKSWFLFGHTVEDHRTFRYDRTPPVISILSQQHLIRQGGAETAVYSVSESPATSGVMVGDLEFQGYPLQTKGEASICLFALPYDGSVKSSIRIWARDEAGNRAEAALPIEIGQRNYRSRRIDITTDFIERVAPEILSRSSLARPGSDRETYLLINSRLRQRNNDEIREIAARSSGSPTWTLPFLQLSNSAVEALFADSRTYYLQGQEVDRQTHLGFDLASVANSPVEAANDGSVIYADYLGIYGNSVLIDHGLGLLSLYAHLSEISVAVGATVKRGDSIGLTGQTGLAAGDHLHFSMIVQGVQVTPLEWWDPRWVENHFTSRVF